jgi:hypothetical protein
MANEVALQQVAVPARLQTPEAAAAIAAANAEAAGGIRVGGFPTISIKANKFHEKEGGEMKTYMVPGTDGAPSTPLMCLQAAVIAWNPAVSKAYYKGDFEEGSADAPTCTSSNGVTPDAHIVEKQSPVCATCKQNAWGSKISKLSGKEIKACADMKQLAILPSSNLAYKALGLSISPGSLTNWGKYVLDLTGRNYPINEVVTNITFDATKNGVLNFAFNRFLTDEEAAQAKQRAQGVDVKVIVAQSRVSVAPALPAPAPVLSIAAPVHAPVSVAPVQALTPAAATQPTGVVFPPEAASFGASAAPPTILATAADFGSQPSHVAVAVNATGGLSTPAAEPPKRHRRTRAEMDAAKQGTNTAEVDLSHLPPGVRAIVEAQGVNSEVGKALLAQFPATTKATAAHVLAPTTEPTQAMPPVAAGVLPASAVAPIAGEYLAPNGTLLSTAAPFAPPVPTTSGPVTAGFGATTTAAPPAQPTAAVTAAGASLADKLKARLASFGKPA